MGEVPTQIVKTAWTRFVEATHSMKPRAQYVNQPSDCLTRNRAGSGALHSQCPANLDGRDHRGALVREITGMQPRNKLKQNRVWLAFRNVADWNRKMRAKNVPPMFPNAPTRSLYGNLSAYIGNGSWSE